MAAQTSIGANDGSIVTLQVASSTGPFAVDFPFFDLDDVIVTLTDEDGVVTTLSRGVDFTLTATANDDGIYPSGVVTLTSAVANIIVARYRQTGLERVSQIPTTGTLSRVGLNADLNRVTAAMQDLERRIDLGLRLPEEDGELVVTLPPKSQRAGLSFIWDSEGNAAAGSSVTIEVTLNSFMTSTFLPNATAADALAALGGAGLADNNTWSGSQVFTDDVVVDAGVTVDLALADEVHVPTPASAGDDTDKAATTEWVNAAIAAALSAVSVSLVAPTFHEVLAGAGNFATPANAKWLVARWVGGGGGGVGGGGSGSVGGDTTFNGVTAKGGAAGSGYGGGLGGDGGAGTADKRKRGMPGGHAIGDAATTVVGAPGHGGASHYGGGGAGSFGSAGGAGKANSGGGGGGASDVVGGFTGALAGGGAGEWCELRIANPSGNYAYSIGGGGSGGAGGVLPAGGAGGSGYLEIEVHYNY